MRFPVICLYPDGGAIVSPSLENLSLCTKLALQKRIYFELKLIDCDGTGFKITNIKEKKMIWHWPSILFFNPMYKVTLEFQKNNTKSTLKDVQKILGNKKKRCIKNSNTIEECIRCHLDP